MRQPIPCIREVSKRLMVIARTHAVHLTVEKSTLQGERFVKDFSSAFAPCRTIGTRGLYHIPKSQEKHSTVSPTSIDYCKRIIGDKALAKSVFLLFSSPFQL